MKPMHGRESAFSLIELLATLAIVAMLAALAVPAYGRYACRARRVEGRELLLRIAHAQERHYAAYNRYGELAELGFAEPAWSDQGYYRVTLQLGPGERPQTFIASAWPSSAQQGDVCGVLTLDDRGGKAPGPEDARAARNGACW